MKISLVYFLSVVAGVPSSVLGANDSSTYRTLRRVKDLDDEDEKLLVEEIFDGDAEQRKLAAPCDEICRAKRRLVRCKKKAREEAREGRNAWTKEDQEKVGGGRRLKLYCESFSFIHVVIIVIATDSLRIIPLLLLLCCMRRRTLAST